MAAKLSWSRAQKPWIQIKATGSGQHTRNNSIEERGPSRVLAAMRAERDFRAPATSGHYRGRMPARYGKGLCQSSGAPGS